MNKRTPVCLVLKSAVLLVTLLCVFPLFATNPQKKEMKELNVKKVSLANVAVENIPALLDKEKVAFQSINTVNWKAFPYQPEVQFRIAHTDDAILVHYKVKEASVRAVAAGDNGAVWEDACVEFFSIPAGDGIYYNVECNCAGTLLIGAGAGRENREHAPQEVMDKVQRWSSLGRQSFEERVGECNWELALVIPYSAFSSIRSPVLTERRFVPISTNAVINYKRLTSFLGILLLWKSLIFTVPNSSAH